MRRFVNSWVYQALHQQYAHCICRLGLNPVRIQLEISSFHRLLKNIAVFSICKCASDAWRKKNKKLEPRIIRSQDPNESF